MNRFLKVISGLLIALLMTPTAKADEGMWIPLFLKSLNEAEMQELGMKITAEDIYSVNKSSLKDAIVHFGGGCTGEIISPQGLLLTNHHCGYGEIQSHSSVENDYLKNGFWAKNLKGELANPGLTATFIKRIEEVSEAALEGVTDKMSEAERSDLIRKNLEAVRKNAKMEEWQEAEVKAFYKGNRYFLFIKETFTDVRLVGAPPQSIGKYGSDTDNWVWPRHTGDFSIFRVYADKNNRPAEYSEDNVPYTPGHHLPISLDGVEQGDFTMVFGFPGRTNEYLPSFAVDQLLNVQNPVKIEIRDNALKIVDKEMRKSDEIRIKYASKYASIANYWKKWIGESQGLRETDGLGKKLAFEKEFSKKVSATPALTVKYGHLLREFRRDYNAIEKFAKARDVYSEVVLRNVETTRMHYYIKRYADLLDQDLEADYYAQAANSYKNYIARMLKDYNADIDRDVFVALMEIYLREMDKSFVPESMRQMIAEHGGLEALADHLYASTDFNTTEGLDKLFAITDKEEFKKALSENAMYTFTAALIEQYNKEVVPQFEEIDARIQKNMRTYMRAQMEVFPDRVFYPDANSTMRVSYGQVKGMEPRDGVTYRSQTYLKGVVEKYKPGDYEYDLPQKLIDLYNEKDYGIYGVNGKMPVCFIATNHTTGGNSGSPAIDAHGNLIGLNFDRLWEGTMSDINYDPSICRNIMVDIRYVLFIVDKFAGSQHLIDELTLVRPKQAAMLQGVK